MTAAHRQRVLESMRKDIDEGCPVRLVATLDQIAQAAGRCSRNELGPGGGRLVIFAFTPGEGRESPREIAQNAETAQRVLRDSVDPLSREATAGYFRELLWTKGDGGRLMQLDNVKVGEPWIRGS
jgi:CRISPR-associated endonuclease/helicase Cas3